MKCPKCGYHSFDHLDACKKCREDLRPHKAKLGISAVRNFPGLDPGAPLSQDCAQDHAETVPDNAAENFDGEVPADNGAFSAEEGRFPLDAPEEARHCGDSASRAEHAGDYRVSPVAVGEPGPVEEFLASMEQEPVSQAPSPPPASRRRCLLAAVTDVGVLAAVFLAFMIIGEMGFASRPEGRLLPSPQDLVELSVPYFLVLFTLSFGYFTLFHFLTGQTPGKMAAGIRVEGVHGETLLFSQAFLRSVGGLLSLLPLGAGYLLAIFSPTGRGWNDQLAGTHVVGVRPGLE